MTVRALRIAALLIATALLPAAAQVQDRPPSFAVRVEGTGPAMILIPGFLSSGAVWDDVVAHYRSRYTCHVVTLPGVAGQPAIEGPVLARVREEIAGYIRAQRLNKPVLLGHSLGGFLALWIAATAADLAGPIVSVDGVPFMPALINPAATAESMRPQAEQLNALYASMTAAQLQMQTRMALATMMSDPARADVAAQWAATSDPQAASQTIAELMTTDLRTQMSAITTRVLLVPALKAFASTPAAGDRALAAYRSQVQAIPSVDIVPATQALHFVMYDDLPFLLKTMDAFLATATPSER